jgi:HD-GYP domain-containing protein (c-di-GMP phosphodiesterase class II)
MELAHDVVTISGELLLSSGTTLTKSVLDDLSALRNASVIKTFSFMKHRDVAEDLLAFISLYPYNNLFREEQEVTALLDEMNEVQLVPEVLESLDYFLEHDTYSYKHFLLVFMLSTLLARDLVPNKEERILLTTTGPAHDIGKMCVPLEILTKVNPLTAQEKTIIDNHSLAGYVLLGYYMGDYNQLAPNVARDHHERKDGSGKPTGKKLDNFLVEIIAACDVYDALMSPRPYRMETYDNRAALEILTELGEKNQISSDIIKALIARNRGSKPHYKDVSISTEKRGIEPKGNLYGIIE